MAPVAASLPRSPTSSPKAVGDLYFSSLIELGLILFVITFVLLAFSKLLLMRLAKQEGQKT